MANKHFNPTNNFLIPADKSNPYQKSAHIERMPRGKLIILWMEACTSDSWDRKKEFERKAGLLLREWCLNWVFLWTDEGVRVGCKRTKFGGTAVFVLKYADPIDVEFIPL